MAAAFCASGGSPRNRCQSDAYAQLRISGRVISDFGGT